MNRALPIWLRKSLVRLNVLFCLGSLVLTSGMRADAQEYEVGEYEALDYELEQYEALDYELEQYGTLDYELDDYPLEADELEAYELDDYGAQSCDDDRDSRMTWNQYENACRGLAPRWIARGSAVYMDRVTPRPLTLFQNTTNLGEQVNADDFDFGYSLGVDASLIRKTWDEQGLELRFLGLDQFNASTVAISLPSLWQINSTPPLTLPNVQAIDAMYRSRLWSIEANYSYLFYDYYSFLCGLRFVSLDEQLWATLDATPQTFAYDTSTQNDLYGAQVGLKTAPFFRLFGCVDPSVFAKVGVFGNDSRQRSLVDTGPALLSVHESSSRVAWVGELGISAEIQLSHHLWILGGYSLLWMDRVALAGDQVVVNDFFDLHGIDNRGTVLFHGANLGVALQL